MGGFIQMGGKSFLAGVTHEYGYIVKQAKWHPSIAVVIIVIITTIPATKEAFVFSKAIFFFLLFFLCVLFLGFEITIPP